MSIGLDNRLGYIQARRRGVDFKALQEQETDRRKAQIVSAANQLGVTLTQRQNEATQKVEGLIEEVITEQPFLESEEQHLAALKTRLDGLKAVQELSKIRNANAREEWMQSNPEKKELLQKLAKLKTTMQSVPKNNHN